VGFHNVYSDAARAAFPASLEFPNTYYLAFRDWDTSLMTPLPAVR
jgi:hypothetical protein